jgi:microcystin-dependent protein
MRILAIIILFIVSVNDLFGQAPQAIPYQAAVRNSSGTLLTNQSVKFRFSIRSASASGTVVYQETQSATTNSLGLAVLNVGQGTAVTGTFSSIDWTGGTMFLQVEIDPAGGTSYTDMGTQQLMSVPYSLSSANGVPVGSIEASLRTTAPSGWLLCDGSAVSRTTYANLFAAIGTSCGSGDGSTTFNLPDFRGRFLRGVSGTSSNDPDKTSRTSMATGGNTGNNPGSVQADDNKSHTHTYTVYFGAAVAGEWAAQAYQNASSAYATQGGMTYSGGNEARPKNAYVNYIIKY